MIQSKDGLGLNLLPCFYEHARQIKIIVIYHTFKCTRHLDLHLLKSQMKSWSGACGLFLNTHRLINSLCYVLVTH